MASPSIAVRRRLLAALFFLVLPAHALDASTGPGPALGTRVAWAAPPEGADAWTSTCSTRLPLCVQAAPRSLGQATLATLSSTERAWDTLTGALGLPAPEAALGGPWRIYLIDGVAGAGRALPDGTDPRSRFDRASSFGLVDRRAAIGCSLDLASARAVAGGSLWRSAPATDEGSASAETEYLAELATGCPAHDDDVAAFQSRPEAALVDPTWPAFDRGASLFFGWLDATFAARAGALVLGVWALAPTRTPWGSERWAAAPNGFDVLRASLRGRLGQGSTFDDVLVRFAVARASLEPAPHAAWRIPWPSGARRLAAPEPPAPTGASYVVVDHAGAPPGSRLRVEAQWEDYGRMRWVLVKRDATGKALAELPVRSLDRGTNASMTLEGLDGVADVLIVGVDMGSTERTFDPTQAGWEPHGWLLTIGAE